MLALALPIAAALLAYAGAIGGEFVFDDLPSFVDNTASSCGDWWEMAFGNTQTPLSNRPFVCWTFAINPAIGGSLATGYRAGNLLIHVANALLVLAVLRRCLLSPNLAGRFPPERAGWFAIAVATWWACHPLGTDAVAYATQRTTLLMSGCFLAALWCVLRGWRWQAVVALALGMASKEELVGAPLLIVLFERAFLLPDWRSLRARVPFHLGLASTWLVLATCVVLGPHNDTVGYDAIQKVSAWQWLMTESGVLLHYLRLCVWPHPLRGAYDDGIVRDLGAALPAMLVPTALFAGTVWQWRQRPWLGWLGALFFLLLGPTSSVMPIVTEVAAERRMYLPMLSVLVPVALLASRLAPVPAMRWALGALVVVPSILATRAHAATYTNERAFWTEVVAHNRLDNGSLGTASILQSWSHQLRRQGRTREAHDALERAMAGEVRPVPLRLNYAGVLGELGRFEDSERVLRAVVDEHPRLALAASQLAAALVSGHEVDLARGAADASDPRLAEALQYAQRAQQLRPDPQTSSIAGLILLRSNRLSEAEATLASVVRQHPGLAEPKCNLAAVYATTGRSGEALRLLQEVLVMRPDDCRLRLSVANLRVQTGDRTGAALEAREVLRREPGNRAARALLEQLEPSRR
jgi:tetratricopeptide (TPR) repeat protein